MRIIENNYNPKPLGQIECPNPQCKSILEIYPDDIQYGSIYAPYFYCGVCGHHITLVRKNLKKNLKNSNKKLKGVPNV